MRRVYTDGQVKPYGKRARSLRAVPLPQRAAEALASLPIGISSALVFQSDRGGHLSLHEWRRDIWTPALKAAGLTHRGPYALRHTYASVAIATRFGGLTRQSGSAAGRLLATGVVEVVEERVSQSEDAGRESLRSAGVAQPHVDGLYEERGFVAVQRDQPGRADGHELVADPLCGIEMAYLFEERVARCPWDLNDAARVDDPDAIESLRHWAGV